MSVVEKYACELKLLRRASSLILGMVSKVKDKWLVENTPIQFIKVKDKWLMENTLIQFIKVKRQMINGKYTNTIHRSRSTQRPPNRARESFVNKTSSEAATQVPKIVNF